MNILMILSKEYSVDPRVTREATSLIQQGHKVTVLVWNRISKQPELTTEQGVNVIRINNTTLMKTLSKDLFRNPLWWNLAYKTAMKLYKNTFRFDVVHCHDLDTLKTGVKLKEKLHIPLIYDAHEIFGDMIVNDVPKIAVSYAFHMEKKLIKHADQIITVNEPLEEYFTSITDKPVTIVMNCKNILVKKYTPPKNKQFTLCYFGFLHQNNMFPDIVHLVGKMKNIEFLIAGKQEPSLYGEIQNLCNTYDNITFLGTLPHEEIMPKTQQSNAVFGMVDPSYKLNRIGVANKIFEAMAAGRPALTTKNTYRGDLIENTNAGLTVEYNKNEVQQALIKLRDNPTLCEQLGKNGLHAVQTTYNWDAQKLKLLQVYEDIQ